MIEAPGPRFQRLDDTSSPLGRHNYCATFEGARSQVATCHLCCSPNDVLSIDAVSIRLSFIINPALS